jgi:hypothetical protein
VDIGQGCGNETYPTENDDRREFGALQHRVRIGGDQFRIRPSADLAFGVTRDEIGIEPFQAWCQNLELASG